jgi:hypothetical protein
VPNFANTQRNVEDIAALEYNIGSTHVKMLNYAQAKPCLESSYLKRVELFGCNDIKSTKVAVKLEECEKVLHEQQQESTRRNSLRT